MKDKKDNTKLSVVIIAKNEEIKLPGCLESLMWADEIILIDNGSDDRTSQIARKHKAKVFSLTKAGYSSLRNKGLSLASGEWVLYVDADERVTPELKSEISDLISNSQKPISGDNPIAYAIPRCNIILGREMKHGGWWPDYVKRLFRRDKLIKWTGDLHEEPIYDGIMGHLENSLVHVKEDNLSDMVAKTNKWSEIEARLMFESGHPQMNLPRFLSAIIREFWYRIVVKKAFLDGAEGMIFGIYQVYSRFISYAKLWEMQTIKDIK